MSARTNPRSFTPADLGYYGPQWRFVREHTLVDHEYDVPAILHVEPDGGTP